MLFNTCQYYFNYFSIVVSLLTFYVYKNMDPLGVEHDKARQERD